MPRTTLNIDKPVLDEVREIQERRGGSLGEVVSSLLAEALSSHQDQVVPPEELQWTARRMRPRVDLADKGALYAILDEPERR